MVRWGVEVIGQSGSSERSTYLSILNVVGSSSLVDHMNLIYI